jgi:hypothetical protein
MNAEKAEAIKAIVGQIEALGVAIDGHLQEMRDIADDQDSEDIAQRLEFAFAELRAARHELTEATKYALEPA